MDHHEATKSMTAERYTLGELSPEERDAFEEHFFDCTECADEVRDAAKFAAGVRTGATRVVPSSNHLTRWAIAAGIVIAVGLGYQLTQPHRVRQPAGLPAGVAAAEQPIELESTRAPRDAYRIRADQPVSLYFVIPPPEHSPENYLCALRNAAGGTVLTMPVTREQAQNAVRMPLKPSTLHSGQYKLEIRGGDREIAAYPFTVVVR
jgi:hypothetical protein